MRPNPVAPWELRIGNLRVYYDVEEEPEPIVYIRAIGVKLRNLVRIAKEVIELRRRLKWIRQLLHCQSMHGMQLMNR